MRALITIALTFIGSSVWAQDATAQMEPAAIRSALDAIDLQPGETLYDLGCGEGRVLLEARRNYGARVLGVEIDPAIYRRCQANMQGRTGWKVIQDDATLYDLSGADVVTVYLYADVLERIRWDTLKPGARVISYCHPIPGLQTTEYRCQIDGHEHVYYLYREPK